MLAISLVSVSTALAPVLPYPWRDPQAVFAAIESRHADVFWLDAGPSARSGWSYIGWGESAPSAPVPGDVSRASSGSVPFSGGWVGWADYDPAAAAAAGEISGASASSPGSSWIAVRGMWAFDHAQQRVWRLGDIDVPENEDYSSRRDAARASMVPGEMPTVRARDDVATYAQMIQDARVAIARGDAYQLCVTTRFTVSHPCDPVTAYLRLRQATPAPYGGIIRVRGVSLLSASPEQFLRIDHGRVTTRPIKGTRPRGTSGADDQALATELRTSRKEVAENVMIVDLMRNDLHRVSEQGTVNVDALLAVESYPAVHQLVSTVSGRLRAGTTLGEVWEATFPAGSMTGAPKVAATRLLREIEREPRGIYAGCFGYVGHEGCASLAMTIRSAIFSGDEAYVGAGGGITWLSDADEEIDEVALKARAPLAALGAALPGEWAERVR